MKLLVTYKNGKTQTLIGIEKIEPIKNSPDFPAQIYVEGFNWASRLDQPRDTENRGIAKMELIF